jgi:DNA-binding NarL/FixJ family response regulator
MNVFIADDSEVVCERLKIMLSEIPKVKIVGEAKAATEAIKLIEKLKPDVVLLDLKMPGGNGIDVLISLKKYKPALVIIMLTNYPYPQYRKKCMEAGADYFFDKSTDFEKVLIVLKKLIQKGNEKEIINEV